MRPNQGQPVEILLVEDSPSDVFLTRSAFKDAKVANNLHVVSDGLEALRFLNREGPHEEAPVPDLILLDLNLPKKDGREVLQEIKSSEKFGLIPVIVLTTSEDEADVAKAYRLHANSYITKPVDFEQFSRVVAEIDRFWFTVVKLPSPPTD